MSVLCVVVGAVLFVVGLGVGSSGGSVFGLVVVGVGSNGGGVLGIVFVGVVCMPSSRNPVVSAVVSAVVIDIGVVVVLWVVDVMWEVVGDAVVDGLVVVGVVVVFLVVVWSVRFEVGIKAGASADRIGASVIGVAVAIAGLEATGVGHLFCVVVVSADVPAQCLFMHSCIAAGFPTCADIFLHTSLFCARVLMSPKLK